MQRTYETGAFSFEAIGETFGHTPIKRPAWTPRLNIGAHLYIYTNPVERTGLEGLAAIERIDETEERENYFLTTCLVRWVGTQLREQRTIRTDK